ncbi:MAG: hypothetical protein C0432_02540 [Candidatus Puniceispirillum sp.]|nr:hypothetical protein [Candidatus Pelagibacter sp.]MBA4283153.1 hypothetical protein [Candidatus Puniceispirillum sp.]
MTIGQSTFSNITKDADGRLHLTKRIADNSIDFNQIIDEIVNVKTEQKVVIEDKIKIRTEEEIPAVEVLRDKMNILQKSLESLTNDITLRLKNPTSLSNGIDIRTANIKSTDDAVSILASTSAQVTPNNTSINVSQLATKDRVVTNYSALTLTEELGFSGNLSINNMLIEINSTDTLNDIVSKINLQTESSRVSASTIQTTESGGHKLVLESIEFAKPINFQGTEGTSRSLFTLIPINNTESSFLNPDGEVAIADTYTSEFGLLNADSILSRLGSIMLNGETFQIGESTTLNNLVDSINGNSNAGVTASITTSSYFGQTYSHLTLTANGAGIPIDYSGSSTSLYGLASVTINSVNDTQTDSYNSSFAVSNLEDPMGLSGSFVINNVSVSITSEMTAQDLMDTLNALGDDEKKVTAAWVAVGVTGTYQLQLTATQKGVSISSMGVQATDNSLSDGQGLQIPLTSTDVTDLIAKFKFNNIDIERNSNVITNLIDGVTINLNSISTKDTIFSIEYDKQAAYININQFVDAYNDVVKTMAKYSDDQDGKNKEAVLKDNPVISHIKHMLHSSQNMANLGESATSASLFSLGDLGITFVSGQSGNNDEVEGMLLIDQGTLVTKIMNGDYKNVVKLFGDYAEFSNSEFNIAKFPETLNPSILGKEISIDYALVGASSTDEIFALNFSIPKPSNDFFDSALLGKKVDLSLQRDEEGNYSAIVSGVSGISSITSANVINNVISFPDDSSLAGVTINFIGENIQNGSSLQTSFTLPDVVVTLSSSGNDDVIIHNVQSGYIECPSDSVYSGINILFEPKSSTLVMGGVGVKSKMVLTQGIAKDFVKEITAATKRKVGLETPNSLFDVAVSNIKQSNETDERKIESLVQMGQNQRKLMEPLLAVLYSNNEKYSQVLNMIDLWTGKKNNH